jgi:hypothetical protein
MANTIATGISWIEKIGIENKPKSKRRRVVDRDISKFQISSIAINRKIEAAIRLKVIA